MHERTPQRARLAVAVAIGAVGVVLAGAAIATPGQLAVGTTEARGTLGEDQIVNSKSGVHLKTKGSVDVATQQITIQGGGHTGVAQSSRACPRDHQVGRASRHLRRRRDV